MTSMSFLITLPKALWTAKCPIGMMVWIACFSSFLTPWLYKRKTTPKKINRSHSRKWNYLENEPVNEPVNSIYAMDRNKSNELGLNAILLKFSCEESIKSLLQLRKTKKLTAKKQKVRWMDLGGEMDGEFRLQFTVLRRDFWLMEEILEGDAAFQKLI